MRQREAEQRGGAGIWVVVTLVVGVVAGILVALYTPHAGAPMGTNMDAGMGHHEMGGPGFGLQTPEEIDVILSTVGLALLVALAGVYVRIYVETRAAFSLGLVAVFLALLVETLATWPLVFGLFGHSLLGLGPFLLLADVFKVTAFSVLLYLSLS